jgi:hypothetical protein
MSMQSWANMGYLVDLTEENLLKFVGDKELVEIFFEEKSDTSCSDWEVGEGCVCKREILNLITEKWGLTPSFIYLSQDTEGWTGAAVPEKWFLCFGDDDKYQRTIKEEWKNLPVEPEESSWSSLG